MIPLALFIEQSLRLFVSSSLRLFLSSSLRLFVSLSFSLFVFKKTPGNLLRGYREGRIVKLRGG